MSFKNNGNIANCISILKKSILINKKYCNIPFSKNNLNFLLFLYRNGYIEYLNVDNNKNIIKIFFKLYQDKYVLHSIKNFFKPGHKNFFDKKRISRLKQKNNIQTIYILWTSYGFMTLSQAFYRRTGGILVCKIN
jgi:ribosomal protein S8